MRVAPACYAQGFGVIELYGSEAHQNNEAYFLRGVALLPEITKIIPTTINTIGTILGICSFDATL